MWDCVNCGCMQIAASLGFCPACLRDRAEEPLPEKAPEVITSKGDK